MTGGTTLAGVHTNHASKSETVSGTASGPPSLMPAILSALLSGACAAGAVYVGRGIDLPPNVPLPADQVGVLLALAAGVFGLGAAWLFGKQSGSRPALGLRTDGFQQLSAAALITDVDGRIVHLNAAAEALLAELKIDRTKGRALDALGLAANPDEDAGFLRLSGRVVRWRARRLRVEGRVWQLDDVTDIVKGHAELQRDLTTLQDIFDLMPLGFLSAGSDGLIDRCNVTLATWLGETPETMLGRSLGEFVSDGRDSGALGGISMGVLTLQPKEGAPFVATLMQTAKTDALGNPVYTRSMIMRDVALDPHSDAVRVGLDAPGAGTGKRTDDEVDFDGAMLSERLRWLYHEAPIGIAFLDMDGTITDANAAFNRLLGNKDAKPVGIPFADYVAREDRDEVQGALSKAVMGIGQGAQLEARLARADGREMSVNMTAAQVTDAAGDTVGLILHFVDTTEHRNLEVQFTQSQKMQAVGQLAGGVAHDFNNLLTAMIGFSDLLLTRRGPDDPDFADIMQIKQNANRATNLVRQVLAFSRKQKLEPEVIEVTGQLSDLSNLLGRLIGETVTLKMDHGRGLGAVLFDKGQFDQVVINLCVNARDAMPGGGTISITTKAVNLDKPTPKGHEILPAGQYVTISIADTGTGIPRENMERIFEPFFSTKEVGAGTGLGLSTVYGIVHQAEGFIFVDSAVGKGTTFTLYLPVHGNGKITARDVTPPALDEDGDLTGQGTILLVEDEDAVRLFGSRALRNKGYHVLEATDGETALDVIAKSASPIDLIISDVVMPGMDGHTLINLARQELPGVKTILMSGYSEDVFRNGPDMDPGIAFLGKPFTLKGLAAKVKDVLEN